MYIIITYVIWSYYCHINKLLEILFYRNLLQNPRSHPTNQYFPHSGVRKIWNVEMWDGSKFPSFRVSEHRKNVPLCMGILAPPVACSIFTQDSLLILLREIGISLQFGLRLQLFLLMSGVPTPGLQRLSPGCQRLTPTPDARRPQAQLVWGVEALQGVF